MQDLEQRWLDLNLVGPDGHNSKTLFSEATTAWVSENGAPIWLPFTYTGPSAQSVVNAWGGTSRM